MDEFSFHRWTRALLLTLVAVVLLVTPANAHPVRFWNQSGDTITSFFTRHSGSGNWGDNILAGGTRKHGEYLDLRHGNQCYWDIGLYFSDGSWWESLGEDLCGDLSWLALRCEGNQCWLADE